MIMRQSGISGRRDVAIFQARLRTVHAFVPRCAVLTSYVRDSSKHVHADVCVPEHSPHYRCATCVADR